MKVFPLIIPAQVIVVSWAGGRQSSLEECGSFSFPEFQTLGNYLSMQAQGRSMLNNVMFECTYFFATFVHKVIVATGISYGARVQAGNGTAEEPRFGYAITGNIERG